MNVMEQEERDALAALERLLAKRQREVEAIAAALSQLRGGAPVLVGNTAVTGEYLGLGIVEAAERYLTEVGKPQTTRELADALTARGLRSESKNLTATIYATLTNAKKKFRRTPDGAWELVAQQSAETTAV